MKHFNCSPPPKKNMLFLKGGGGGSANKRKLYEVLERKQFLAHKANYFISMDDFAITISSNRNMFTTYN